jgi:hypothetical protein
MLLADNGTTQTAQLYGLDPSTSLYRLFTLGEAGDSDWHYCLINGNDDIYGQRLTSTGGLTGSNFVTATGSSAETAPALAWHSSANAYLVVWQRDGNVWATAVFRHRQQRRNGAGPGLA